MTLTGHLQWSGAGVNQTNVASGIDPLSCFYSFVFFFVSFIFLLYQNSKCWGSSQLGLGFLLCIPDSHIQLPAWLLQLNMVRFHLPKADVLNRAPTCPAPFPQLSPSQFIEPPCTQPLEPETRRVSLLIPLVPSLPVCNPLGSFINSVCTWGLVFSPCPVPSSWPISLTFLACIIAEASQLAILLFLLYFHSCSPPPSRLLF